MPELNTSTPDGDDVLFKPDEIQFDQAEYATPVPGGPVCRACKRPILDSYYEINGNVVCAAVPHRGIQKRRSVVARALPGPLRQWSSELWQRWSERYSTMRSYA